MSNQIATHNTKEKKAEQVELARKLDANIRVTNFRVLFAAYRACVQGPLAMPNLFNKDSAEAELQKLRFTIKISVLKLLQSWFG